MTLHSLPSRPVLVAGAAGFIGSHLCERLLQAGAKVLAVDNLSSGDERNLRHLTGHPRLRFMQHDLCAPWTPSVYRAVRRVGRIFNLACPASPAYYQSRPVATVLASAVGTWRLLELAQHNGARLLQASTSEVYGDPQVHPQPEAYWGHVNPIGVRSCYDEGKRCAEAMCLAYARERGAQVRIARLFNCYGPRLRPGDGRVVSNFIVQALAHEPITIYGDGAQTRSFCYVSDTVDALLALMDSGLDTPVNIGRPDECSIRDLAGRVQQLTASRSALCFQPLPQDDPVQRCPDIGLARAALGWTPRVPLDEGLRLTIAHFAARQPDARTAEPAAGRWPRDMLRAAGERAVS